MSALESELLRRQVILGELDQVREASVALDARITAMRQQLSGVDIRLLAAGLVEESATGWLEVREGGPDRVVITGPGPARRMLIALGHAAERAPGLRVVEVEVKERGWRVLAEVEDNLPALEKAAPTPAIEIPAWPWRHPAWDDAIRLRAELISLDAQIGIDIPHLEARGWEATLLEHRLEAPDRLARLPDWLEPMFGGTEPVVVAATLALARTGISGTADLGPAGDEGAFRRRLGPGYKFEQADAKGRVFFVGSASSLAGEQAP